MTSALLQTRNLRIEVPGRVLVADLTCDLHPGQFVALLGGNGAGKSLLLRTLAGLRRPAGGQVLLRGDAIESLDRREIARRLGFLPQDPESAPQGTVGESVMLGRFAHLGLWQPATHQDAGLVAQALDGLDLHALEGRELGSLSGGEQRRAAIARLLVQAPAVYLLDEPTNHLDPAQQIAVLQGMRQLTHAGAAVLASLHDPNLALRFADRVFLVNGTGDAHTLAIDEMGTDHLARLYGLPYAEGRIGGQRLMAPQDISDRS